MEAEFDEPKSTEHHVRMHPFLDRDTFHFQKKGGLLLYFYDYMPRTCLTLVLISHIFNCLEPTREVKIVREVVRQGLLLRQVRQDHGRGSPPEIWRAAFVRPLRQQRCHEVGRAARRLVGWSFVVDEAMGRVKGC